MIRNFDSKVSKIRRSKKTVKSFDWKDWKDIYFAGTISYKEVSQYDWNFNHFYEQFVLSERTKNIYVFGTTEFQLVQLKKDSPEESIVQIPVLVVIESDYPPSDKIGIASVQLTNHQLINLKEMKMDWYPYLSGVKTNNKIFFLKCNCRQEVFRKMKIDDLKMYEYCIPYIPDINPTREVCTETIVFIPIENKNIMFNFDWSVSSIKDAIEELTEDYELTIEQQDKVRKALIEAKQGEIRKQEEQWTNHIKEIEAIPSKKKESILNSIKYKFYPQNDEPMIDKVKSYKINRYYGNCNIVQ